jgi:hypothetical protein
VRRPRRTWRSAAGSKSACTLKRRDRRHPNFARRCFRRRGVAEPRRRRGAAPGCGRLPPPAHRLTALQLPHSPPCPPPRVHRARMTVRQVGASCSLHVRPRCPQARVPQLQRVGEQERSNCYEVRYRAAVGVGEEAHSRQRHWCPWSKPVYGFKCGDVHVETRARPR